MSNYLKIGLTLVIGFAMAFVFSGMLEKGSARFHLHKRERMQELFVNNTSYDVLFIGSSRTHTTINPAVVDSITGLRSYNAGMEGANLAEFKLVLDAYLEKHPAPRLLVLTIDANSFNVTKKMFFPFQYFWVLENKHIREAVKDNKDFHYFFIKDIPFMRQIYYDDYAKMLAVRGLLGMNEFQYSHFTAALGYATNGYECADTALHYPSYRVKIIPEGVELLKAMIDTCKKRGIALALTYAPELNFGFQRSIINFSNFADTLQQCATAARVPWFRDEYLPMCNNPCLFSNYGHVNAYGATVYSRILGQRIADSLLTSPKPPSP